MVGNDCQKRQNLTQLVPIHEAYTDKSHGTQDFPGRQTSEEE